MSDVTAVTEVTELRANGVVGLGTVLLEVHEFLSRFIAYPSEDAGFAHALWIAHAHAVECFDNTPRLAFLSPEPGSGKSRAMELTEALVPRPLMSVNATVSAIFRSIGDEEKGLPTLLLDEVDSIFSGQKNDANEDLRGLLNSGYRKGAYALRSVVRGREIETEKWPSFSAVALAGLNQLPETLMTRSIVIAMKRRRSDQTVEPYRRRIFKGTSEALSERLATVIDGAMRARLESVWPDLPEGIEDRNADLWEPILAIADEAGGAWPSIARITAVRMVKASQEKPATLGIRLLADIRKVLGDVERISTNELLTRLHGLESAPWGSVKGEPIDSRFLARMLTKYEIDTNNAFKLNGTTVRGYRRSHFVDAWDRYLPHGKPEIGNQGNQGNHGLEAIA